MDIKKEIDVVLSNYPLLSYCKDKDEFNGELFITKSDSYEIRIGLNSYPEFFPIVHELNGRIPNKLHRHIYTDTGSCCFTTRAKSQVLLKTKITTLALFIKDIVIPYFQNNSYYEINGKYKSEEYSHGSEGVVEGYRDILQIDNDLKIAQLLARRIEGEKLKIQHQCYCGSGKSLKKCTSGLHDRCYRNFRIIDKNVLNSDLGSYLFPNLKIKGLI